MDITVKDSDGKLAPVNEIGKKFRHTGRNEVYEVIGFCWIGDTDQWGLLHSSEGKPIFCRSVSNFFGERDGEPRFVREK